MSTKHRNPKKQHRYIETIAVPIIVALIGSPFLLKFCNDDSSFQELKIKGRILDIKTKLPIQEAKVSLEFDGNAKIEKTDSEGVYIFEIQKAGSKLVSRVTAEASGYEIYKRSLELMSDATQIDDIFLEPLSDDEPSLTITATPTPKLTPTPPITQSPTVKPSSTHDIALLIVNDDNTINWNISHKIAALLRKKGIKVNAPFSDRFVTQGSFENIFRGNQEEAGKAGLLKYAHHTILGKITGSYVQQSGNLSNMITAKTRLELHVLKSETGMIINSAQFKANGVGFDEEKALDLSLKRILENLEKQIETLLL